MPGAVEAPGVSPGLLKASVGWDPDILALDCGGFPAGELVLVRYLFLQSLWGREEFV